MAERSSNLGGARPGSGRPKGKLSPVTVEKNKIQNAIDQIILKKASKLVNAQMKLALGASYLYRKTVDPETKQVETTLVQDETEIQQYINGEFDDMEDVRYYNITTTKPNGYSIENLLDRMFGKPKQSTELSGDLNVNKYSNLSDDELKRRIRNHLNGTD